ncbi:MAG: hypothetical protein FJY75_03310 [Candidatus Eisenbacteria bacterium]|uniref:Bifunctional metallophosphatase/5'-nucleotidase n=1 Tax=Eiseniibacteriota bacterium TaxID=2212470 RepID=A0A938BQ41_UNCEI|nr:hypothetical protein [Candidatus Eisenbacteria bacterium]
MARRAAFIDSLRRQGAPILLVDSGDFLHRDRERSLPLSRLVWEEFRRSGYHAVGLGKEEFLQWDLVQEWLRESPLPLVTTNVEHLVQGDWVPIGEKYRVVKVNGVNVGVVSVTSENQLPPSTVARHKDTLRLLPPLETTQRMVDWLRQTGGAEVIVLLAEIDNDAMEQFASLLQGVDAILGGYQPRQDVTPKQVGRSAVLNRSGTRGQTVASTQLIVSPEGRVVDFGGQNVVLTEKMPEDANLLKRINDAKNESTLLKREAMREQSEAARANRPGRSSGADDAGAGAEAKTSPLPE